MERSLLTFEREVHEQLLNSCCRLFKFQSFFDLFPHVNSWLCRMFQHDSVTNRGPSCLFMVQEFTRPSVLLFHVALPGPAVFELPASTRSARYESSLSWSLEL